MQPDSALSDELAENDSLRLPNRLSDNVDYLLCEEDLSSTVQRSGLTFPGAEPMDGPEEVLDWDVLRGPADRNVPQVHNSEPPLT